MASAKLYSLLGAVAVAFSVSFASAQNATTNNLTGIKGCDALLLAGLGDSLVFPSDAEYTSSVSTYYGGGNRQLRPYCIVQPRSTEQVSATVKALRGVTGAGSWDVAVRSGGHSDWNNNAVARGVTIDLTFFNQTTLTKIDPTCTRPASWNGTSRLTRAVLQVRPAARWGAIFAQLEPWHIAVAGGRSGHVGAGGLLLGGGASYHTQKWGLSCDGVINYEVVLADGSVVNANAKENADLFKALKGGGNNFGIVTRYDLRTFTIPPDGIYGGLMFIPWANKAAVISQFTSYIAGISASGSEDHEFVSYRWVRTQGPPSLMVLGANTAGDNASAALSPLWRIPTTINIVRKQPLSALAATINDLGGSHYNSYTLVVQNSAEMMEHVAELFEALVADLTAAALPVDLNFVFQPLPRLVADVNPGGNVLGLDKSLKTNSLLFEARTTMPSLDIDGVVTAKLAALMAKVKAFSDSLPNPSPFIYMNYASPEQDVVGSYGEENVKFLKETATKYDPTGFFQTRVPGGWKLNRL